MKDYTVENPVFSEKISIVEEEDLVSAENDTAAAKQLIQNDLVLSKRMKQCLGDAPEHGDSKDLVVTFESGDEESADGWTDVPVMQNVEDHKTIFRKISNMVKNVRYLYNLLGTTDISGCGADTVTGAIKKLSERKIPNVTRSASVTQEGQQALDAVEKNAAVPGTMAYDLAQINSNIQMIIRSNGNISCPPNTETVIAQFGPVVPGIYFVDWFIHFNDHGHKEGTREAQYGTNEGFFAQTSVTPAPANSSGNGATISEISGLISTNQQYSYICAYVNHSANAILNVSCFGQIMRVR